MIHIDAVCCAVCGGALCGHENNLVKAIYFGVGDRLSKGAIQFSAEVKL